MVQIIVSFVLAAIKGGLQAVTVLLGAYVKATGEPIAGTVNQPFWRQGT